MAKKLADGGKLTEAQQTALTLLRRYGKLELSNTTDGLLRIIHSHTAEALAQAGYARLTHMPNGRMAYPTEKRP